MLIEACKIYEYKNWKSISTHLGGLKTEVQCLHRWSKVLNPELTKGPWTEEVSNMHSTTICLCCVNYTIAYPYLCYTYDRSIISNT